MTPRKKPRGVCEDKEINGQKRLKGVEWLEEKKWSKF